MDKKELDSHKGKVAEFSDFCTQSWVEMKKVNWPNRKELFHTTLAVFALVAIMAIFLGSVGWIAQVLLNMVIS